MDKKQPILSRELIIHPGTTIEELLEERGWSQKELAVRTGFSEKHISTVISGQKGITPSFAYRLEIATGLSIRYWLNLQQNFDVELISYLENNQISSDDIDFALEYQKQLGKGVASPQFHVAADQQVIALRKLLGYQNLRDAIDQYPALYRAQFNQSTHPMAMLMWQKTAEERTTNQALKTVVNRSKLRASLSQIKAQMHGDVSTLVVRLRDILNDCGILFVVQPHSAQAPIKGLTAYTNNHELMIALSIRGKYADIFWFTLFHEIAHVLNEDDLLTSVSQTTLDKIENRADEDAANYLIPSKAYKNFCMRKDFTTQAILAFAKEQDVLPSIVIGRLQHEHHLRWSDYNHLRISYSFLSNH